MQKLTNTFLRILLVILIYPVYMHTYQGVLKGFYKFFREEDNVENNRLYVENHGLNPLL